MPRLGRRFAPATLAAPAVLAVLAALLVSHATLGGTLAAAPLEGLQSLPSPAAAGSAEPRLLPAAVLASDTCLAVITAVHVGPDGHVTYTQDSTGYSATLGLPVSNSGGSPGCGSRSPNEPVVTASFAVDIDVRCGGLLTFMYNVMDYDADASYFSGTAAILTQTGYVPILNNLWNAHPCWAQYRESGPRIRTVKLDSLAGQQVRLKFWVPEGPPEGNGPEQLQLQIAALAIRSCPIPLIKPLSNDPQTQWLEQYQGQPDMAHLTPNMQSAVTCLQNAVQLAGGTLAVRSGYRTAEYQLHLREVWEKWRDIMSNTMIECQELRTQVRDHFLYHEFDRSLNMPPAGSAGRHTKGEAMDAEWSGVSDATIDALAAQCTPPLKRPFPGPKTPLKPHVDRRHFV